MAKVTTGNQQPRKNTQDTEQGPAVEYVPVPGPQGPPGRQGDVGPQGSDGKTGQTGDRGLPGADSTVPGPQGKDGPRGPDGNTGADGKDSTVPGPQGKDGPRGPEGPASTVPGPPGKDSTVPGPDGKDGAAGADGKDGLAATIRVGSTTTISAGLDAEVTNRGDDHNAIFDFRIPGGGGGGSGGPHEHTEYARVVHNHDAAYQHDHPYAATDHKHDPQDLTHSHPDYFLSGQENDENGNPVPLPYNNAKVLGEAVDEKADEDHDHGQYASAIELEELQVEVDALATTREAGRWTIIDTAAPREGEVYFLTKSMTLADNMMTINSTDRDGKVHGWADLEVGDYVEVVQETAGDSKSVGSYGLFQVKVDNPGTGMRVLELTQDQGVGSLTSGSDVFIKVFHANNDLDVAELDARYALKEHTHSVGAHSHNYEQIAISHGQRTYYGSNINWNNAMYMFPFERRGSSGSLYQGGRIEHMGKIQFKNGSNFYAKIGKSGTLIGTTGESSANYGTFIVMSVWDSTYQSSHSQQGTKIQTIYGSTIWCQDSAKGRNWNDQDTLYWWYRGAGR